MSAAYPACAWSLSKSGKVQGLQIRHAALQGHGGVSTCSYSHTFFCIPLSQHFIVASWFGYPLSPCPTTPSTPRGGVLRKVNCWVVLKFPDDVFS
jgi:hypothetical protein